MAWTLFILRELLNVWNVTQQPILVSTYRKRISNDDISRQTDSFHLIDQGFNPFLPFHLNTLWLLVKSAEITHTVIINASFFANCDLFFIPLRRHCIFSIIFSLLCLGSKDQRIWYFASPSSSSVLNAITFLTILLLASTLAILVTHVFCAQCFCMTTQIYLSPARSLYSCVFHTRLIFQL